MDTIMKNEQSLSQATRTAAYNQEQQYVYWNATDSSIEQDQYINAESNTVRGFNPILGNSPMLNNLSYTAGGTVTTTTTTTTSCGPSGTSSTSSTTNSPFGDIFVILGAIGAGSAVLVFSRRRKLN